MDVTIANTEEFSFPKELEREGQMIFDFYPKVF